MKNNQSPSKRRRYIIAAVLAMLCGLFIFREVSGPHVIIHNNTASRLENVNFTLNEGNTTAIGNIEPGKHVRKRINILQDSSSVLDYTKDGKSHRQKVDSYFTPGMTGNFELHVAEDGVTKNDKLKAGF